MNIFSEVCEGVFLSGYLGIWFPTQGFTSMIGFCIGMVEVKLGENVRGRDWK